MGDGEVCLALSLQDQDDVHSDRPGRSCMVKCRSHGKGKDYVLGQVVGLAFDRLFCIINLSHLSRSNLPPSCPASAIMNLPPHTLNLNAPTHTPPTGHSKPNVVSPPLRRLRLRLAARLSRKARPVWSAWPSSYSFAKRGGPLPSARRGQHPPPSAAAGRGPAVHRRAFD